LRVRHVAERILISSKQLRDRKIDPHYMDRVADHVGGALLAFWSL